MNIAIKAIGLSAWRDWIRSRPPADILQEAGQFLQQLEQRQVPVWKIIVMEAWLYRQKIEDLYAGRLSSEEWAEWTQAWPELKELPQVAKDQVLQEWERHYTELVQLSKLPLHQLIAQEPPLVEIESLKPFTFPAFSRCMEKEARIQTDLRGVRIIVALEHYRSQQPYQGRYPPRLSDLVPEYLPELPKDPFTDEDFVYRRKDNLVYKLYSVGPNKIDDGGVQEGKYWRPGDPDMVIVGAE